MQLQVTSAGQAFLVCTAAAQKWSNPAGLVIASWWKGKWWHNTTNDVPPQKTDVPFKLTSTDDIIYMGMKLSTVGQALAERRASQPAASANVMYHEVHDDPQPESPSHQKLEVKHVMLWRPEQGAPVKEEPGQTSMNHQHAAGAIDVAKWGTPQTSIVWTMKWCTTGLTPVRPQVVLTRQVELNVGEALPISAESSIKQEEEQTTA